jgi:hypothetical protein
MSQLGGVPYAIAQNGKPINTSDYCTVTGSVISVSSGSGPTAVINFKTSGSSTTVTVNAQDLAFLQGLTGNVGPQLTPTTGINVGETAVPLSNAANSSQTLNATNFPNGIQATIGGTVNSITGSGTTATVVVKLPVSGNTISVQASDIAASGQTL